MRTCTIDGCGKRLKAAGLCSMHYYRKAMHGDPHKVCFIPARPGEPLAFLESLPAKGEGCVEWPYSSNNMGYGQINTPDGKKLVTRVLCEKFNGPPPASDSVAAHSCGKGHLRCCAPWHLSWKSFQENHADMDVHGTRRYGESSPHARLTEAQVREIRSLIGSMSQAKIAGRFGLSQTAVSKIHLRKIWARSA